MFNNNQIENMIKNLNELDTPALIIEISKLEQNLNEMQNIADRNGVKLRAHTKTHKMPALAEMQIARSGHGIAVAKVSEAEVFAQRGFRDIQIANILASPGKIERMAALSPEIKISCFVDSQEAAKLISEVFYKFGKICYVYIEINTGHNRSGINSYNEILNLALFIDKLSGISLRGIATHAGHIYNSDSAEKVKEIGKSEGEQMIEIANHSRAEGVEIKEISCGSTPGAQFSSSIKGITEIRAGNYIFNDMIQVSLGVVPEERCALTILATVISIPSENRAIIDAGSKALALDKSNYAYGKIIGKTGANLVRLSEEHGIIEFDTCNFKFGERVRIIPNHACTVCNLFDYAFLVDGQEVLEIFQIEARGKVT
ncbi:MAG: D-ser dehydrat protein [Ignavibacteria bacterium]|nr:D-ser dehydrat protein [Ignavibacteria bacterium]